MTKKLPLGEVFLFKRNLFFWMKNKAISLAIAIYIELK